MSSSPTTTPTPHPQVTLPGQSHTAAGPHDQTGMYLMHYAFRRDLDDFASAVVHTPVTEQQVWQALDRRWQRFAEILHGHHTAEDEQLWPVLMGHATSSGDHVHPGDVKMLEDMEAEHAVVDPALQASAAAFAAMAAHPCADHRNALEIRVAAVRDALDEHLAHEEGQALPMLQRTLSVEENAAMEKQIAKYYPPRVIPFVICWVLHGLSEQQRRDVLPFLPPGYSLIERLLRGGFRRRERRAFRYA